MNTFFENQEVIQQLFHMDLQRCEPQQIYEEMSFLVCRNNFFFLTYFGDTSFDV